MTGEECGPANSQRGVRRDEWKKHKRSAALRSSRPPANRSNQAERIWFSSTREGVGGAAKAFRLGENSKPSTFESEMGRPPDALSCRSLLPSEGRQKSSSMTSAAAAFLHRRVLVALWVLAVLSLAAANVQPDASPSAYDVLGSFLSTSSESITPERFFDQYFEQTVLHVARTNGSAFYTGGGRTPAPASSASSPSSSFDLGLTLESLGVLLDTSPSAFAPVDSITRGRLTLSDLRLVRRVVAGDGEDWTAVYPIDRVPPTTRLDSEFAQAALDRGFTVVVNRLNYRSAPIARLCTMLSAELFGFRVQANLYLTPPGASGFEAHFDWQQSIVLQVAGEKRWTMYDPPLVRGPRADMKFKPKRRQLERQDQGEGGGGGVDAAGGRLVKIQTTLKAGDMLYFPSGVVHEATTTPAAGKEDDQAAAPPSLDSSMHVTLGVEIDPLFTMQGLVHLFVREAVRRRVSPSLRVRLMETIESPTCVDAPSSSSPSSAAAAASSSNTSLTYLDLVNWRIFDAASQVDRPTNDSSGSSSIHGTSDTAEHAHEFRRSLWGLHLWAPSALPYEPGASIPRPPEELTLAQLLLTESPRHGSSEWRGLSASAKRSVAFELDVLQRLAKLLPVALRTGDVWLRPLQALATMQARWHRQQQQTDPLATESEPPRHAADAPSPAKSEPESLFNDAALLPLIEPALHDRVWTHQLIVPASDSVAARECRSAYLARLAAHFDTLIADLLASPAAQLSLHSDDPGATSTITPSFDRPDGFPTLVAALRQIQHTLVTSQQVHLQHQEGHVRENVRRQRAFEAGKRAAMRKKHAGATASRQHPKEDL